MTRSVEIAFEILGLDILLSQLVPSKLVSPITKTSRKFQQIKTSIAEVGLVEPIAVHPIRGAKRQYLIVDGHLRVEVLKDLNIKKTKCLIAKDDEAFTYNKRINRISSVQEHYMILRAIKNGVPEDRIARALGVNIASIRRKRTLLNGICDEVVEILKNKNFSGEVARIISKLKPVRQIEVAELMVATNNYSSSYAKALFVATNSSQILEPDKRSVKGLSEDELQRMEQEMASIQRDIKAVENNYGANMLRLVVANGYVGRLLDNQTVVSYLNRHHRDVLEQLSVLQDSIDADLGISAE